MGRQAFFSIFENFIRNTSKHQAINKDAKREVNIVIAIKEEGNHYIFNLYDLNNISNEAVLEKIKKALKDDFVDSSGKLNSEYKGIKEMRISAAWLRGKNVAEIRDEQNLNNSNDELEKEVLLKSKISK